MGRQLGLDLEQTQRIEIDYEERRCYYMDERDRLLAQKPDLIPLQEEIDRRLAMAGSMENRLSVLGIMIEANLNLLRESLVALTAIQNRY